MAGKKGPAVSHLPVSPLFVPISVTVLFFFLDYRMASFLHKMFLPPSMEIYYSIITIKLYYKMVLLVSIFEKIKQISCH